MARLALLYSSLPFVTAGVNRNNNRSTSIGNRHLRRRSRRRILVLASTGLGKGGAKKEENFMITTPLYYANAPPHMGSAYTTIAADAIARFHVCFQWLGDSELRGFVFFLCSDFFWILCCFEQRLLGEKVIFVTGTDEHGEKIATSASAAEASGPKEHCDSISLAYQMLWKDVSSVTLLL